MTPREARATPKTPRAVRGSPAGKAMCPSRGVSASSCRVSAYFSGLHRQRLKPNNTQRDKSTSPPKAPLGSECSSLWDDVIRKDCRLGRMLHAIASRRRVAALREASGCAKIAGCLDRSRAADEDPSQPDGTSATVSRGNATGCPALQSIDVDAEIMSSATPRHANALDVSHHG